NIVQQAAVSALGTAYGVTLATLFGFVVNIMVSGFVLMGLFRIYFDVLLGGRADLGRITSQLPKLGRYVIAQAIILLVLLVPLVAMYLVTYVVVARSVVHASVEDYQAIMRDGSVLTIMLVETLVIMFPY